MAVVVVLPCVPATAIPVFPAISVAEKFGALEHRDAGGARGQHFGVIIGHGGGAHHQVGAGDILGAVAGK